MDFRKGGAARWDSPTLDGGAEDMWTRLHYMPFYHLFLAPHGGYEGSMFPCDQTGVANAVYAVLFASDDTRSSAPKSLPLTFTFVSRQSSQRIKGLGRLFDDETSVTSLHPFGMGVLTYGLDYGVLARRELIFLYNWCEPPTATRNINSAARAVSEKIYQCLGNRDRSVRMNFWFGTCGESRRAIDNRRLERLELGAWSVAIYLMGEELHVERTGEASLSVSTEDLQT